MVEFEVSKYVILELNFRWGITGAKATSRKHGDLWRIINPAIFHEIEFIWKNKKIGNLSCIEMKVQTRSTVPWRTWEPLEGSNLGNMLAR